MPSRVHHRSLLGKQQWLDQQRDRLYDDGGSLFVTCDVLFTTNDGALRPFPWRLLDLTGWSRYETRGSGSEEKWSACAHQTMSSLSHKGYATKMQNGWNRETNCHCFHTSLSLMTVHNLAHDPAVPQLQSCSVAQYKEHSCGLIHSIAPTAYCPQCVCFCGFCFMLPFVSDAIAILGRTQENNYQLIQKHYKCLEMYYNDVMQLLQVRLMQQLQMWQAIDLAYLLLLSNRQFVAVGENQTAVGECLTAVERNCRQLEWM